MALNTLHDLYVDELKDLYDAEKQLVRALPKLASKANAAELRTAFEDHLQATRGHVKRLETILKDLGLPRKGKPCKGMKGLINESKALMEEEAEPEVMDAGLIAGAQRAEHYEITAYGTLRTWAETLGFAEAADLMQQTLDEEEQADQRLTQLAESFINRGADAPTANQLDEEEMPEDELEDEDALDDEFSDEEMEELDAQDADTSDAEVAIISTTEMRAERVS